MWLCAVLDRVVGVCDDHGDADVSGGRLRASECSGGPVSGQCFQYKHFCHEQFLMPLEQLKAVRVYRETTIFPFMVLIPSKALIK